MFWRKDVPIALHLENLGFLDLNALFYTDQATSFSTALFCGGSGAGLSLKKMPRGIENPTCPRFRGLGGPNQVLLFLKKEKTHIGPS